MSFESKSEACVGLRKKEERRRSGHLNITQAGLHQSHDLDSPLSGQAGKVAWNQPSEIAFREDFY